MGDTVTALDISFDKNRADVERLLDSQIPIQYFDHHFAGDIPASDLLTTTIDTSADVCTGLLVSQHLKHRFLPWAVTALFGDNLHKAAEDAAAPLDLNPQELEELNTLGTLLNYNGYGSSVSDLHFRRTNFIEKFSLTRTLLSSFEPMLASPNFIPDLRMTCAQPS